MNKQSIKTFVGIDVAKQSLEVCIGSGGKSFSLKNNCKSVERLALQLSKLPGVVVIVESTGGYERLLTSALWNAAIPWSLLNPRQPEAFRRSLGTEAKTDAIDSRLLALFGERMAPRLTAQPSREVAELQILLSRRQQLVGMLTNEKNHLSAPLHTAETKSSIRKVIACLKQQKKDIEIQIEAVIKSSSALAEKAAVIQLNKGAGPQLAAQIVANLPEIGTLNRKKIAASCEQSECFQPSTR